MPYRWDGLTSTESRRREFPSEKFVPERLNSSGAPALAYSSASYAGGESKVAGIMGALSMVV